MFGVEDIDFEKCGDVIVAPGQKVFALCCSLCHDVFMHFAEFRTHIIKEHEVYLGFSDAESVIVEEDEEKEVTAANVVQENEIGVKTQAAKDGASNDEMDLGQDIETQNANIAEEKNHDCNKTKEQENEAANATENPMATVVLQPIESENAEANPVSTEENQSTVLAAEANFIEGNEFQIENSGEKQSEDIPKTINSLESIQQMDVDEIEANPMDENLPKTGSSPTQDKPFELENLKTNKNEENKDNIPDLPLKEKNDRENCNKTSEKTNQAINHDVQTIEKDETAKEEDSINKISENNVSIPKVVAEDPAEETKQLNKNDQDGGDDDILNIDKEDSQSKNDIEKESIMEKEKDDNHSPLIDEEMPQVKDTSEMLVEVGHQKDNEIRKEDDNLLISTDCNIDSSCFKEISNIEQECKIKSAEASKNSVENIETMSDMEIDEELTLKATNMSGGNLKDANTTSEILKEQNSTELLENNVDPSQVTDRLDERTEETIEKSVESSVTDDVIMDNMEPQNATEKEKHAKDNETPNEKEHKDDENIKTKLETEKEPNQCLRENVDDEFLKAAENENHAKKTKIEDKQVENGNDEKKAKLEDEQNPSLSSDEEQLKLVQNETIGKQLNQSAQETIENDSKKELETNQEEQPKIRQRRKSIKLAEFFEDLDLELDDEDEDMRIFESLMLREDVSDEEEKVRQNEEEKNLEQTSEKVSRNLVNAKEEMKNVSGISEGISENGSKKNLSNLNGNESEITSQSVDQPKAISLITTNNDDAMKIAADSSICDKYVDELPIAIEDDARVENEVDKKMISKEKVKPKNDMQDENDLIDIVQNDDKENCIKNSPLRKFFKSKIPLGDVNDVNNAIGKYVDKNKEAIEKFKSDVQNSKSPNSNTLVQTKLQTLNNTPGRTRNTPKNQNKVANVDTPRPTLPINRTILNNKRRFSVDSGNALNSTKSSSSSSWLDIENVRKMPKLEEPDKEAIHLAINNVKVSQQKPIRTSINNQKLPIAAEIKASSIESIEKKSLHADTDNVKCQDQAIKVISKQKYPNIELKLTTVESIEKKSIHPTTEITKKSPIITKKLANLENSCSTADFYNLPKGITITKRVPLEQSRASSSNKTPAKSTDMIEIQKIEQLPNLNLSYSKGNPQSTQMQENCMDMRRLNPVVRIERLKLPKTEADFKSVKTKKSPRNGNQSTLSDSLIRPNTSMSQLRKRNNECKEDDDVIDDLFDQVSKESNEDTKSLSGDEQDEAPKIRKFDAQYDATLLGQVGLSVILEADFESKSSIAEIAKSQSLAKQFSKLLNQSALLNRNPDKDGAILNGRFTDFLKSVNNILPKPGLEMFELKRVIFLITRWYTDVFTGLLMQKNPIPHSFEKYIKLFSFIPRTSRRSFYCEYCNVWFFALPKLEAHRAIHFEPLNKMACVHCTKNFKRPKSLEMHEEKCKFKN